MAQIVTRKLELVRPDRLVIDVAVKLQSASTHISRLTYGSRGLYDVARTFESPDCPIDIHRSFHPSGEMHCKLTRGRLAMHPGGQILGEAQPHTEAREILLWQRQGQPWQSLRGVEKFDQYPKGIQSFTNVTALVSGYPAHSDVDADYVFEIPAEQLNMVAVDYFLVEPGNVAALEDALAETVNSWRSPHEPLTIERADLFVNLRPWLAVVLTNKRAAP